MKKLSLVLTVLFLLISISAFAGNLDGVYKFSTRTIEGAPNMQGWWGMMVIKSNTMTRMYRSTDGTTEKFYVGDLSNEGDVYKLKLTHAYKPNYVGNEHQNKIILNASNLSMESLDGKFIETWIKK